MIDDLKPIRVFLEVAALRSFAAAARSLSMTPATVTRTIARLETELGQQLLLRSTRQVALTAEGAALVAQFRDIVAAFDQATRDLAQARHPDRGRIRVTAPLSFGMRLMPAILDGFSLAYPQAELQVTLDDRLEDVMEGGHDLAIRISQPPRDKTTIWRKICAVPRCVVASPALFDRHPHPTAPADLDPALCLGYASGGSAEVWRFRKGARQRQITAGQMVSTNNGDLLAALVARGCGMALLPDFIVQEGLAEGRLLQVLPDWDVPQLWLSLTYPAYEALPPLVATFSDFFEASLRDVAGLVFAPLQSGTAR